MTSILFLTVVIYCNISRYNYLRKLKIFSEFFSWHFLNLELILNIFRKKTALEADVFLNLWTPKNVVRYMSKKSCFREPFEKEHGKWSEILLKSERQHLYHIY